MLIKTKVQKSILNLFGPRKSSDKKSKNGKENIKDSFSINPY